MRTKGKITRWNDEKGFGFIKPKTGGREVFVHIKAFGNRNRRPGINQVVSYALSFDAKGRPCAKNATLAGVRLTKRTKRSRVPGLILVAALFLLIVAVSMLRSRLSTLVLAIYSGLSLLTFIIYAIDKSAAKKGAWRTQENTLHLLSLAGGWPGALIAQQTLRHKSRKRSFQAVFWLTVLLNCGALAWLFTPSGSNALSAMVSRIWS